MNTDKNVLFKIVFRRTGSIGLFSVSYENNEYVKMVSFKYRKFMNQKNTKTKTNIIMYNVGLSGGE